VNKQTIVLIAVAVVAAIAAILVLLPSEGPVTVPKTTAQGVATVSPSGTEMRTEDVSAEEAPKTTGLTVTSSRTTPIDPNRPPLTAGLEDKPGIPLDVHGQKDSHVWIGIYRMLLQDNGGPSELADRVHEMGTTVAGVTSANTVASYAPLFAEERKLLAEVRASSSNEQILANCTKIEEAITAIESGHLHPSDKRFETANATP
jgi:hypothetical protein